MHDLFISYSRADAAIVSAVAKCLKEREFAVWFDQESILNSQDVVREIDGALTSCRLFVLFASHRYFGSEWATAEYRAALYMALSRRSVVVVIVKLDDVALPPLLAPLNYITYTTPLEVCEKITRLRLPTAENNPAGAGQAAGVPCSWSSLEDAFIYVLVEAFFANLGSLRQQSELECSLRVATGQRQTFNMTLSLPLVKNEMLMADLQSEWRIFKVLKKTVNIHSETIRKGGLGIFQPAFEITLEEKLSELNASRAAITSQMAVIAPKLLCFDAGAATAEGS